MAFLTFDEYKEVQGLFMIEDEDEFTARANLADLILDQWTLGRASAAVEAGHKLPKAVRQVWCLIADNASEVVGGSDDRVASFSNGQDSYTFQLDATARDRTWHAALMMLPVEWISATASTYGEAPHEG